MVYRHSHTTDHHELINCVAVAHDMHHLAAALATHFRFKHKLTEELQPIVKGQYEAITVDGWTSTANESFLSLTRQHINEEHQLVVLSLECVKMDGSTTAENLTRKVLELTETAGVEHPVCCTTDCEPSMVAAGRELPFPHQGCIAHRLETVTGYLFRAEGVDAVTQLASGIVTHFHKSSQAAAALSSTCGDLVRGNLNGEEPEDSLQLDGLEDISEELLDITGMLSVLKLLSSGKTRWWGKYAMLLRLLQLRKALRVLAAMNKVRPIRCIALTTSVILM
jgi:hypothetical protein